MPSRRSFLRIENNTAADCTTSVSEVDNYDWDGVSRPDRNFHNICIKSHSFVEKREELNFFAKNCPFAMTLTFTDGTTDSFRVNQKHAIGWANKDFQHRHKEHDITCWKEGWDKLIIKIENTKEQKENILAQQKNQEAQEAMQKNQYQEAIQKLDEALKLAHQEQTKDAINTNKAGCFSKQGAELWEQAWAAEAQSNSEEADRCFSGAKNMFMQAEGLKSGGTELGLVNLKIEGNQLFNKGTDLENEAYEMFESAKTSNVFEDLTNAQNKYKEAMVKYELAKSKFEEGARSDRDKFEECTRLVKEEIEAVKKVVGDIDKIELNYNLDQVLVNDEEEEGKEEEEVINDKVHVQIDAQ